MRRRFNVVSGVAVLLIAPMAVRATTVRKLDMPALTRLSALIVQGKVVGNDVVYEKGPNGPLNIHTLTTIAVSRTFKGEAQETVTVTGYGGVVGDISHNWPGVPRFKEGEKAILFLFRNLRGELTVTGLEQGRMTIIDKPGVGRVVTQTFAGLKFGGGVSPVKFRGAQAVLWVLATHWTWRQELDNPFRLKIH